MRPFLICGLLFLFIYGCVAPPVTEQKKKKHDKEDAENNEIEEQAFDVEYKRYLQEVVNILEKDDDFKTRLEKADPDDIKSGKIAKDIEFVNHNVRSKLDELKRQELERLRQAAMRQYEHDNGIDRRHLKIPAHIDPNNPHTFEAEDLRKLIVQTTKDLEDADRRRKAEFKEYEMHKELEYQEQLKRMDEKNRANAEKQHEQQLNKHKEHKPLHHPGSKAQIEEVWEEQDHMSPEDFNPKTFFHLHDLDGNGHWDANEVKALFRKELDKMYDPNAPEDDMKERMEEMERMREHVFNETDQNKDQLISFQEFLEQTKKTEFEKDEGWDPIDQHPQYSQDEYQQYARAHEEEIRRMIEQGLIPPAPPGYVPVIIPPGTHPDQLQGLHPQMPPPGVHPNAIPQGQYHPQDPQHLQHLQAQQHAYQQQHLAAQQQGQLQYHGQPGATGGAVQQQQLQHHPQQQQQQLHHPQQGQIQQQQLHPQQGQIPHQQQFQQPPAHQQQQVYQPPPAQPVQYNNHPSAPVSGHGQQQQQLHQEQLYQHQQVNHGAPSPPAGQPQPPVTVPQQNLHQQQQQQPPQQHPIPPQTQQQAHQQPPAQVATH